MCNEKKGGRGEWFVLFVYIPSTMIKHELCVCMCKEERGEMAGRKSVLKNKKQTLQLQLQLHGLETAGAPQPVRRQLLQQEGAFLGWLTEGILLLLLLLHAEQGLHAGKHGRHGDRVALQGVRVSTRAGILDLKRRTVGHSCHTAETRTWTWTARDMERPRRGAQVGKGPTGENPPAPLLLGRGPLPPPPAGTCSDSSTLPRAGKQLLL